MGLFNTFIKMATRKRESEPPYIIVRMPEKFGRSIGLETPASLLDSGALRAQQTVIVDCSDCRYIDSNGIGLLVELRNNALKRGANLILAAPTDRVQKIIEVTRLHRVFAIYGSLDEAIAASAQSCALDMYVPQSVT